MSTKAQSSSEKSASILDRLKELAWLGTVIVAVIGSLWGVATYLNDKRLEYVKTFSDKQIEILFDTGKTVAMLLTVSDEAAWNTQIADFYNLYWGPLVLVESPEVEKAMFDLCNQLQDPGVFYKRDTLRKPVFEVATKIREQIKKRNETDWQVELPSLSRAPTEVSGDPKAMSLRGC